MLAVAVSRFIIDDAVTDSQLFNRRQETGRFAFVAPAEIVIVGTIGAWSVFKAVYIDKRDIKCACVGGGSNVPLGFISLSENLGMMAMAIWMFVKAAVL